MKVELDKESKVLRCIPESYYEAYRLGVIATKMGWEYVAPTGGKLSVLFSVDGLLKHLEDNGSRTNPNQP